MFGNEKLAVMLYLPGCEVKIMSKSAFKKPVCERLLLAIATIFLGCFFVSGSYRNTGQRNNLDAGTVSHNAKSYDAAPGHLNQAETMVASPGNRKNLYRYAYVADDLLEDTNPTDPRPYTPPTLISSEQWYGGMYVTQKRAMTIWSHITHSGRKEVIRNAEQIAALSAEYSVDATMVAAAIAQQASDVERVLGDFSDELSEKVGALSVGISQLHRTELTEFYDQSLLPGEIALDPYDPEVAIRGMAAKIQLNDEYLAEMMAANPQIKISMTDRWMLLALAQNHGYKSTDDFFGEAQGEWESMLALENYHLILRYFVLHLEWLKTNGWPIPDDVSLDAWKMLVFHLQNTEIDDAE
jgi:hypothetical protein